LRDGSIVRIALEVGGEVGEKSGLHEIGHIDQVEGNEVGHVAAWTLVASLVTIWLSGMVVSSLLS
jgi:hypothetical protein